MTTPPPPTQPLRAERVDMIGHVLYARALNPSICWAHMDCDIGRCYAIIAIPCPCWNSKQCEVMYPLQHRYGAAILGPGSVYPFPSPSFLLLSDIYSVESNCCPHYVAL